MGRLKSIIEKSAVATSYVVVQFYSIALTMHYAAEMDKVIKCTRSCLGHRLSLQKTQGLGIIIRFDHVIDSYD